MKILGRELLVNNNSVYHTGNNPTWQEIQSKPSTFPPSSHNHGAATNSASGFMSATDKSKLDGIATGANNYTHPTSAGNKHIPSGGTSGQILVYGGSSGTATWGNQIQISNTLTDTSVTNALSANQGKILKGLIDEKADSNHVHNNYLTTIPNKIDKSIIFEANGEVQRAQPSTAGSPCYYTFYKDKANRSGYLGYESSSNSNLVIKNEINNANLDIKTTGTGIINLNSLQIAGGNTVQHSSSLVLRADSEASSSSESLILKAGHNELKVASSAGGSTVTKGQDKLTFNGNVVYHAGNKPSELNRTVFEGGGSLIGLKPSNPGGAFFLEFFKDKVNRSAYVGYGNSGSDEFRIYNTISGADINFVTTSTGKVMINNRAIYHEGNKPSKSDIGLSNVQNWTATSATNDSSTSKYATAAGVKAAYDKANSAYTLASNSPSLYTYECDFSSSTVYNITLPSGFTRSNVIIVGAMIMNSTNTDIERPLIVGMDIAMAPLPPGTADNKFSFYYTGGTINQKVRVVIMKVGNLYR